MMPRTSVLLCGILWLTHTLVSPQTFAQESRQYGNGIPSIVPRQEFGARLVTKRERFVHGINELAELGKLVGPKTRLEGKNIRIGVWDAGLVLADHVGFTAGRVIPKENTAEVGLDDHATHVAGIVSGTGSNLPVSKGMAPQATILSFHFDDDLAEMRKLAEQGNPVSVSNHSYGPDAGWAEVCTIGNAGGKKLVRWLWSGGANDKEDFFFGLYNDGAVQVDRFAVAHPNWTQVISAGNSRSPVLDPKNAQTELPLSNDYEWALDFNLEFTGEHQVGGQCGHGPISSVARNTNRENSGGFGSLPGGNATAKNGIVVGSMLSPRGIFDPARGRFRPIKDHEIEPSLSSSFGPTDDGRIKPDIIAIGHEVVANSVGKDCAELPSCLVGSNEAKVKDSHAIMSGTSMAAPVVTGAVALLNELSKRVRNGRPLRSDEARALLIHTARTPAKGPNYRIGWGMLRAYQAGLVLLGQDKRRSLRILTLKKGSEQTVELQRSGRLVPRATLVWIDPPGKVQSGLNNRSKVLVNNINSRLVSPNGKEFLPWRLDPDNPNKAAEKGVNDSDNVERIDVPKEHRTAGNWKLIIDGRKIVQKNSQKLALVVSGFEVKK